MDDYGRKPSRGNSSMRSKLKVLLLLVFTNLVTVYFFSGASGSTSTWVAPGVHLWDAVPLIQELNATQGKLSVSNALVAELHRRLANSNSLLESLLAELGQTHDDRSQQRDFEAWLQVRMDACTHESIVSFHLL